MEVKRTAMRFGGLGRTQGPLLRAMRVRLIIHAATCQRFLASRPPERKPAPGSDSPRGRCLDLFDCRGSASYSTPSAWFQFAMFQYENSYALIARFSLRSFFEAPAFEP